MDIDRINRIAQGRESFDKSIVDFNRLGRDEQISVLDILGFVIFQASATDDDYGQAMLSCDLPAHFTPLCLKVGESVCYSGLRTKLGTGFQIPAGKTIMEDNYRLMMTVFSIADARRMRDCGDECGHWWHHLDENSIGEQAAGD